MSGRVSILQKQPSTKSVLNGRMSILQKQLSTRSVLNGQMLRR